MPGAAATTLADLARLLESLGLRWYVFGAQAAIHYGSARVTADVDVTIELGSLGTEALVRSLGDAGIEPRIPLDDELVARARVLPMVHRATGMGVDVVLAGPGPEELFLDRARLEEVQGTVVRIAAPTDMVVMKVLAGRPKDIEDVTAILRTGPEGLDVAEARAMLQDLGSMLGQSDLVATLDAALQRARRP